VRRAVRLTLFGLSAVVTAGIAAFVFGEFYNLTAIRQHPLWVFRAIAVGRDTVVALDARDVEVPADFAPSADPQGVALYRKHCAQCHGAPGVAPAEFALGMMPVPSNLVAAARNRPPREIYWFIRFGLKMSGMPAWEMRMSDADMWRLTALVEALPSLSPPDYAALAAEVPDRTDALVSVQSEAAETATGTAIGDPERGRIAMQVHACLQCHMIPGLVGKPDLHVGPSLGEAGRRRYIAGVLRNTPENMVRWIMDPQAVDPLSAMPDLGVPEALARDMTAYLYTISGRLPPGRSGTP